jgi:formate hydrogenlyase subunit 3/multisubunit Na+/H+ antiporter MnhD subunit
MMLLLFAGIGLISAGGLAVIIWRRSARGERLLKWCAVVGSAMAAAPALRVLATGEAISGRMNVAVPGGPWVAGLDPLSAIFLLTILVVGAAGIVYGITYLAPEKASRAFWLNHAVLVALVVGTALVVVVQAVLPFLCAWEVMAIASYLLIVTEHEHAEVRRAGLLYLVVTHAGTLALFVMFAIWSQASTDWSFAALAAAAPALPHGTGAIFALALAGFGIKAGAVPAHFWLPPAHAAAPSHVSAVMSGIVIKTGIYGLLRVVMLAGGAPAWWGWAVLAIGAASAVFGVLWALAQHDLKRLLAYHSVENIGIIMLGIGTGALGAAYGHPALAVLGYAAAALHTVNHALFKSVLFLGAGAVYRATGTRNMEELGGLARQMPMLALTFTVGAAAIIGVPPLNGFVSEWLVYQGLLRAGITGDVTRFAVLAVPLLALVGGLALACFAKVVGVVFLGNARSARATEASEAPRGLLVPTAALAAACVALGLLPVLVVSPLLRVGAGVASLPLEAAGVTLTGVALDAGRVSMFAAAVVLTFGGVWWARGFALRRRTVRRAPTWGCAYDATTPRMQYTASSFATPLLDLFGRASGVEQHRGATVLHTTPTDIVLERAIKPLWFAGREWALRLRAIQQGRLHFYLLYVVATLFAVLAYLVLWPS